ncbi:NAD(P)/FAD-dependent oxidoreductase [Namhaeicola litoreus]|uniref:NAD(P)/FAD-dependent oxidoreductase n=1 Tax=Namhaeicola litoreus TaxID=1052145 RepID=A0ABW3Y5T6_9FLAO
MNLQEDFDVIVVGGGLAGLTSALHLSKSGIKVLIIEKQLYPFHKVCGEYVSNEVLPYINSLGFDPFQFDAKKIERLILSTPSSKYIESKLDLGGFGLSRYTMDHELSKLAVSYGATLLNDVVIQIDFKSVFTVHTKSKDLFRAKVVLGTFGKRSNLDLKLKRRFIQKDSPYLAVKSHFRGHFPKDLVGLHNFEGGYCGVSNIEKNKLNICYIADYKIFKLYRNTEEFEEQVVKKNFFLKEIFDQSDLLFKKPLAISQISFDQKSVVKNHILMCGDSAGLIHPLCGNGMGIAIHSAQIASNLIIQYLHEQISRDTLEAEYMLQWEKAFQSRLKLGRNLAKIFRMKQFSEISMVLLKMAPSVLNPVIQLTHGKPLKEYSGI